jgi:ABC-type antimicrobial peptide transport system permease subunit
MKMQYGIAGFLIGIMVGLLAGIVEMKLLKHFNRETLVPFAIGITVISCGIGGLFIAVKISKSR